MKHLAGMALIMLCFLLTPALALSDTLLSPMPAAALAVSRFAPNSAFSDLAPASAAVPTSPNIAPASAPSPAISSSAPASAPNLAISHNMPPVSAPSPAVPVPPISTPKPANCHSCGDIEIPYPFGIADDCSWRHEFTITCNYTFRPPKPFFGDFEIANISLETGELRVYGSLAYLCYRSSNPADGSNGTFTLWNLTNSNFLISETRNEFTAVGCNTLALLKGKGWSYYTGCITYCESLDEAASDGAQCAGLGCCQSSISGSLDTISVDWGNGTVKDNNPAWNYSPCSFAFVAEKGWYVAKLNNLLTRNETKQLYILGSTHAHDPSLKFGSHHDRPET